MKLTDSAFRAIEEYNRNKVSVFVAFICRDFCWAWKIFTAAAAAAIAYVSGTFDCANHESASSILVKRYNIIMEYAHRQGDE